MGYVTKERSNPNLPLKPLPELKIKLELGELKFIKFPTHSVEKFIEWVKENELIHKYGVTPMQHINATGGGSFKYAKTIQEKLNIRVFPNKSAKKKNKKKARDK